MKKLNTKSLTKPQINHRADQLNVNKGTSGNNPANAKVHGNRGKQMNKKSK